MPKKARESADEVYGRKAVEAARKGRPGDAQKLIWEIGDDKIADQSYAEVAVWAAEKGMFKVTGEFAGKIKDKKLADGVYGTAAVEATGNGYFKEAGEFAEKAGEYLKQNHPKVLADIYEETGKVIEAKNLRKRLEAKGKKK